MFHFANSLRRIISRVIARGWIAITLTNCIVNGIIDRGVLKRRYVL